MMALGADHRTIDIAQVTDQAPLGSLQVRVVALCGAVALLDGYDTLVIGFAAPSIADHLGISRADLGPVFGVGLLGAAIGGLLLGPLSDRVGRKPMLITSALIFALFSALTTLVATLPQLLALRFLAGIGFGGAAPCFVALASEYAPARYRAATVTLLWASLPLGGILGGAVSALAIPSFGWRALFYFGGLAPLLVAVAAAIWLPESPRFLVRTPHGRARLNKILGQSGHGGLSPDTLFATSRDDQARGSVRALFSEGRAGMTVLLWLAFFFAAILPVLVPLWSPTLLQSVGYSVAQSSLMVTLFNVGAIVGMICLGILIDRFGAARALIGILSLSALTVAPIGLFVAQSFLVSVMFVLAGVGAGGGIASVVALCAMLYSTSLRSTGVGWAAAAGRIGQMIGPVASGGLIALGSTIGTIFAVFALPPLFAVLVVIALARRGSVT